MIFWLSLKKHIMSQQSASDRKKTYDEQDQEITDLQKKYNVDAQEVLNAVIAADNDLEKAEEYLKERTSK
jgi:hypothetical protein